MELGSDSILHASLADGVGLRLLFRCLLRSDFSNQFGAVFDAIDGGAKGCINSGISEGSEAGISECKGFASDDIGLPACIEHNATVVSFVLAGEVTLHKQSQGCLVRIIDQ